MANIANSIYLGNLPKNTTDTDIVELVTPFGQITHLKISTNLLNPAQKLDFAFIKLNSMVSMKKAAKTLNGTLYKDKYLISKFITKKTIDKYIATTQVTQ
ncbi:MAG: RNA-binding protein [Candidatus Shapirobacteria bacterium]|jgi:RNA recognition motif-containing protein